MSEDTMAVDLEEDEDKPLTPQDYLEMAVQAASDQNMATSELLGVLYYYTHSVAATYREDAMKSALATPADQ